jgi:hypothetical protein
MALFTLVGIAGEDDIDAPDLTAPMPPASAAAKPEPNWHGRLNGGRIVFAGRHGLGSSSDDAAVWAHRILGAKNSLTEVDARQVEDAFSWRRSKTLTAGRHQPRVQRPRDRPRSSHSSPEARREERAVSALAAGKDCWPTIPRNVNFRATNVTMAVSSNYEAPATANS